VRKIDTGGAARTATRLMAAGLLVSLVAAGCGDDDDDDADSAATTQAAPATATATAAPTTEASTDTTAAGSDTTDAATGTTDAASPAVMAEIPGGTASDEFCEGFVGIEMAFKNAPEDPAELESFVAEQLTPNVEQIRANVPEGELGEQVTVMVDAVEQVGQTGDFGAFETEEFSTASASVYGSLDDACGIPDVEVSAVDYAFDGVPQTLDAGLVTFVLTNDSEAGEFHEIALVKIKDDVDLSVEDLIALPEEESEAMIESFGGAAFAPPMATSGTVIELTPGRWIYACFIPVGSVGETEGTGPPHAMEGMVGELIVE
jgi:hypothetical protein